VPHRKPGTRGSRGRAKGQTKSISQTDIAPPHLVPARPPFVPERFQGLIGGGQRMASLLSLHLTTLDPEFDCRVAATEPGMESWAGGGPQGRTCGSCRFRPPTKPGLRRRCIKHELLSGRPGPAIRATPAACRHYEDRDRSPPVVVAKRGGPNSSSFSNRTRTATGCC
jgi:hypothetical protein